MIATLPHSLNRKNSKSKFQIDRPFLCRLTGSPVGQSGLVMWQQADVSLYFSKNSLPSSREFCDAVYYHQSLDDNFLVKVLLFSLFLFKYFRKNDRNNFRDWATAGLHVIFRYSSKIFRRICDGVGFLQVTDGWYDATASLWYYLIA